MIPGIFVEVILVFICYCCKVYAMAFRTRLNTSYQVSCVYTRMRAECVFAAAAVAAVITEPNYLLLEEICGTWYCYTSWSA